MKEYEYKIVFLGESGVGSKTSLIGQLVNNRFDPNVSSTNGASHSSIFAQVNLGIIQLDLWDTTGQEKYRSLSKFFIKDSHCVILGYDITRKNSFDQIKVFWYNFVKNIVGDDTLIYLVANKIDLIEEKQVSEKEAIEYANEKGIKFFRVSAKTSEGINELFGDITFSLIMKFKKVINNNDKNIISEITKDKTKLKKFNSIRKIAKNRIENMSSNINENFEKILKKYYNY